MRGWLHRVILAGALGLWGPLAVCAQGTPGGETIVLYPDQDFENEKLEWGFWPAESKTRLTLDTQIVQHGKQSLRFTAVDAEDRAFALAGWAQYQPGVVYRVSVYVRHDASVGATAISFFINTAEAEGKPLRDRLYPAAMTREKVGEWQRWSGYFTVPQAYPAGSLLLGVEHTIGRVWFDNLTIEKIGTAGDLKPDVWTNLTMGVEIGGGPLNRFQQHKAAGDALYQMAGRFNDLLWQAAACERELRDLERCATYTGGPVSGRLRPAFAAAEEQLNRAYLAYCAALRAKATTEDPAFAAAAQATTIALKALGQHLQAEGRRRQSPSQPALPAHLGRQDRKIRALAANGQMSRLLWGVWSPSNFSDLERPRYDFEFHSSAPGAPKTHSETTVDFSNVTEACDNLAHEGFSGTFGYLAFGIHERMYAPQWLVDKYRAEPDFFKLGYDGGKGGSSGSEHSLNYFHPAVRQYLSDYLGQYATFCRQEPRVLFHEVDQEAYPGFTTDKGFRLVSYGPHMVAAFRAYLQRRYPTIAALNQAWGSSHADFAAVTPPPDPYVQKWDPPTPLTCEFANFAEQAYLDYLKLIYDSLKRADPGKPVVARHSSLLSRINGARVFETCDVLSFHSRAPQMNLLNLYLNSLNRYARRSLGYMEDFWGCQDEADRVWDERAQRHGLEKHVVREGFWGRALQMKWYAYTTGSYLFTYNGNWLNPRTDLLTWRYAAPGLQTAKQRLENVDWMLTHSTIPPFKLLVLQPSASMRNEAPANPPYGDILGLYGLLAPAGLFFELVPEEYVADGRCHLSDYAAIVLPRAKYLAVGLQQSLANYVQRGGTLVALGRPGVRDELARPSGALCSALQGLESPADRAACDRAWDTTPNPDDGAAAPAAVLVPAGQGHVLAVSGLGALTTRGDWFITRLQQIVPRDAWAEDSRFEVLLRVAEDGGRYLCLLNPSVDEAVQDTVHVSQAVGQAVDIAVTGGCPVPVKPVKGGAALNVRLGPGEATVIYLGR